MFDFIRNWFVKRELSKEQDEINKLYASDGLTEEVLERQIALNIRRNELNISDESQIVNDEGFVQ